MRRVFHDLLCGASSAFIAEPPASLLREFGVRPPVELPAFAPTIHAPTLEDCARYGAGLDVGALLPSDAMEWYPVYGDLPPDDPEPMWPMAGTPWWSNATEVRARPLTLDDLQRAYDTLAREPAYVLERIIELISVQADARAAHDERDALVTELVALAKAGNREDFDFLAGSAGVEDLESLWTGTRARLGKTEAV
jgi:hypothetical protein